MKHHVYGIGKWYGILCSQCVTSVPNVVNTVRAVPVIIRWMCEPCSCFGLKLSWAHDLISVPNANSIRRPPPPPPHPPTTHHPTHHPPPHPHYPTPTPPNGDSDVHTHTHTHHPTPTRRFRRWKTNKNHTNIVLRYCHFVRRGGGQAIPFPITSNHKMRCIYMGGHIYIYIS